jgi:hypothetical protein
MNVAFVLPSLRGTIHEMLWKSSALFTWGMLASCLGKVVIIMSHHYNAVISVIFETKTFMFQSICI